MPVTTVSADQFAWVNGRRVFNAQPNNTPNPAYKKPSNTHARRSRQYQCRAEQRTPQLHLVTPGSPVAFDCEGVMLDKNVGWRRNGVGRVSIVNIDGKVVYDTFVYYPADVKHRPPPQRLNLGVKYNDILAKNGAQPHAQVLADAKAIFDKSGIVVAHAATNDTQMMDGIDFSAYEIRDTQTYGGFPSSSRSLSTLASVVLGRNIQAAEHSSVEDARATMDLYLWHCDKYPSQHDHVGKPVEAGSPSSSATTSESAANLDSGSSVGASERDTTRSSSSDRSDLAPDHVVALPDIGSLSLDRDCDRKTETPW